MIKKPYDEITLEDVIQFPIWEWAFDAEDDEFSTCQLATIPINALTYHAHIIFTINNQFQLHGLIFDIDNPPKSFGIYDLCPQTFGVFLGGFMEVFDFRPDIYLVDKIKKHLNFSGDVFPISWQIAVLFEGELTFRNGAISEFPP
jgi:hypothetical protein